MFTWAKCFLAFRITATFGPMFKILARMVVDLTKFLVVWIMILVAFSCVSLILFGQCEAFKDFESVLIFYFESSLGGYDMGVYVT